jgi:preprotein translocase subunit YajC
MGYLLLPIVLILMYVLLLRPQQQRLRSQRQLVASLDVGDYVVTAGGIIGRIVALSDDQASIEVADGVVIDFLRAAINRRADDLGPVPVADDEADESDVAEADEAGEAESDDGDDNDGVAGDVGDRPDEPTH